jgi:hypothetical protein
LFVFRVGDGRVGRMECRAVCLSIIDILRVAKDSVGVEYKTADPEGRRFSKVLLLKDVINEGQVAK